MTGTAILTGEVIHLSGEGRSSILAAAAKVRPGQYVYHYTKADVALAHILPTGCLRFSPYTSVNDPRERKEWNIVPIVRASAGFEFEDHEKLRMRVGETLKAETKLLCFSLDADRSDWESPGASMDRGFLLPSMWHHYADSFSGVCLVFDRERLDVAIRKAFPAEYLFAARVGYSNRHSQNRFATHPYSIDMMEFESPGSVTQERVEALVSSHLAAWMGTIFFSKLSNWSQEREFRWLLRSSSPGFQYVSVRDALVAVVIGEAMDDQKRRMLVDWATSERLEWASPEWINGFPVIRQIALP